MRRNLTILILAACLALLTAGPASAWFFDDDTLVTIDDASYTVDDFKRWWAFWYEPEMAFPETPDVYIDWLLKAREAERMELDSDPGFKRQTRIFLQSRGLLMLKNEAVDSRIDVTEAEIKAQYDTYYQPHWLVTQIAFKDDAAAEAAWQLLSEGSVTIDELLKNDPAGEGPLSSTTNWLRPNDIDPGWIPIFKDTEVGKVVDPAKHQGGSILFFLQEQKRIDELDKYREEISKRLWKEQENRLSQELLDELYEKYQVKIDNEKIAALDINAALDTFTDDAVITTTQENVSAKQFMTVVKRLMGSRTAAAHAGNKPEEAEKLKNDVVVNVLAQSLTNWESLDRHYEEKEPFRHEYQFNRSHRLALTLEQRLFVTKANEISEEEIKQHYEANLDLYTQPTVVKLYILDDTQGPVDLVWSEVVTGTSFKGAMRELFPAGIVPQEVPANHLDPSVKAVVDKLGVGETSQVFSAQNSRVIVHLLERTPSAVIPLNRAAEAIRTKLVKQKLNQLRSDYLAELRAHSEINVRQKQWEAIKKELGGA